MKKKHIIMTEKREHEIVTSYRSVSKNHKQEIIKK